MGLATQPVWGKTSGFPLDSAQIGVSFYNNKEGHCNTGAPSRGPGTEDECMKSLGRALPSSKHLLRATKFEFLVLVIDHDEDHGDRSLGGRRARAR